MSKKVIDILDVPEVKKPVGYGTLAEAVVDLRKKAGLSIEQAAGAAGMSTDHWVNMEAGTYSPSLTTLWPIARALNITAKDLFA
jgi:transcriptional regulator with XRE-family HTH domain